MKNKTKKLNVRLLRRVQKAILKHSDQFVMSNWTSDILEDDVGSKPGGCGTAACIGVWVLFLHKKYKKLSMLEGYNVQPSAHRALGLDPDIESPLFFLDDWPYRFRDQWSMAKTPKQAARVAVKRIDHFIKTGR